MKKIELVYKSDGVYIKHLDNNISTSDILKYIAMKRVKNVNRDALNGHTGLNDGIEQKIAEQQEEFLIDADVEISISKDNMEAYALIVPPDGGKGITIFSFLKKFKEKSLIYGINNELIKKLCNTSIYNKKIVIARGAKPIEGKDGEIIIFDNFTKEIKPIILEDGTVDYYNIGLIKNVKKEVAVAKIIVPVEGTVGKNVLGKELSPRPVKPAKVKLGKNVILDKDTNEIKSTIDGHFDYKNNTINVFDTFIISTDVDSSTGNLDFLGNILIQGNVRTGRIVKAGGYVEVSGMVEGATIEAGGDIILDGGIGGENKGVLISGGNIKAKYIEYTEVIAKGDIESDLILHCDIKCDACIKLEGKKGLLVGGRIRVSERVEAKSIGTNMAVETLIEIGIVPAIRDEYKKLTNELEKLENEIQGVKQMINYITKSQKAEEIDEVKKFKLKKVLMRYKKLNEVYNNIVKKKESIEIIIEKSKGGEVRFSGILYPGTKIIIASTVMSVKNQLRTGKLFLDNNGDIKLGLY